jgi:type II secretory pathway component PulF
LTLAEDNLKQGKDMSSALIESGQFPKMATQMIKMGEETGKMEEMLARTAETYDKQLKITIATIWVDIGNSLPALSNISVNCGTTKVSNKNTEPKAITTSTVG